jgi:hypothetical protein
MRCIGRRREDLPPIWSVAGVGAAAFCPSALGCGARRPGWSDESCANEGGGDEEQTACESRWASALRHLTPETAGVRPPACSSHLEIRIRPSTAHTAPLFVHPVRPCLPALVPQAGPPLSHASHAWLCRLTLHSPTPFPRLTSWPHSLIGNPNSSTPLIFPPSTTA